MKFLKKFNYNAEYENVKPYFPLPNVSLIKEPKKIGYNPTIKAQLYDYLYEDRSVSSSYDSSKTVIGICVIPYGILPDKKARFMSIKAMNPSTPDEGGSNSFIYFGGFGYNISTLPGMNYVVTGDTSADGYEIWGFVPYNNKWSGTPHCPSPTTSFSAYCNTSVTIENSLSDFDGKGNTAKILEIDNSSSTDWQTSATISNLDSNESVHSAAQCCWRYNPGFTKQGDWYLPSMGELGFVSPNFNQINSKISLVSGGVQIGYYIHFSSTIRNENQVRALDCYNGALYAIEKNFNRCYIRAFLSL